MIQNSYYVDSISREKYEKALESCKQLFPKISPDDEIYIGAGVSMTKAGWCSVEVNNDILLV